ncbi:MAG: DUF4105 domain-containing protein [Muribaculaceae bacterium]|nr:DUF4105 domain-containing protein [Muribaculaceae bacterium]
MAILIMALILHFSGLNCMAEEQSEEPAVPSLDNLTISLITCYPGPEIYELCGHSAIRVRGIGEKGQRVDSVWNYGIFDFNQPNFVYRFVKGETDYKGAAYPFAWFMPEYIRGGREVVEQDLNLTPEEKKDLLALLRNSVKPENATYRYNYIKDNCSTRIVNQIDSASSVEIIFPLEGKYGTYRNTMRAYHKGYPWYQFGIDVALGSGLDEKTGAREEMFVPVELMEYAGNAHFSDGRPLVSSTRILNRGKGDVTLPPTPWFLSPLFWSWLVALALAATVAWNIFKFRLYLPVYGAWFFILGLAGCLVAFLVFISVHESTSPNLLIFWLNPMQFLFTLSVGIRKLRLLALAMAWYNILACGVLLIVSPWFTQSFNAAFYPLLLATFGLAGAYAIIAPKSSYKRR